MKNTTIEFTDANFETSVLKSEIPVLVDFWAQWCGPCRMIGPMIDQLSEKYQGQYKIGKLNVDQYPEIAAKFGITSIPTLLFFKAGHVSGRVKGAVPLKFIDEKLKGLTSPLGVS